MAVGVGRTEAESLQLNGYATETRGDASGGQAIRVNGRGSATASDTFSGVAGSYTLTVNYFDENDGASTFEFLVNGQVIDSWVGTGGGSGFGTITSRDIALDLAPGDTIAIRGTVAGEEYARVDSLDLVLVSASGGGGSSAAPIGIGLTEAETLDLSGGYVVQMSAGAANGEVIGTSTQGTASGEFTGPDGAYDITVNYLDESDGVGAYRLLVNGTEVATWAGDGGASPSGTLTTETVSVSLETGDTISLEGTRGDGEAARIDSLLIETGTSSPPPPPPPPPPSGDFDIGLGVTQFEDLEISGNYAIEFRSDAAGGALLSALNGSGRAEGTFTGPDGSYEIDVTYFDESDGQATYQLLVNGQARETWLGTGGTSGVGTAFVRTVQLDLDTGDTVAIVGTKEGGELARVDQIEITEVTTSPPPPPPPPPGAAEIDTGVTQIETLDLSGNYMVETRPDAAGNALVSTLNGNGQATGSFIGASGDYEIDVTYFDESDGEATYQLLVNGQAVETWQGTGGTSGVGTAFVRTITTSLVTGDTITISGTKGGGELARVDQFVITEAGTVSPPPPPPPPAEIGVGVTQAENLDLAGNYMVESRTDAAGNALISTLNGSGQATGTFTGASGNYEIDVTYFDESDGEATYQILINGQSAATWLGTGGTSGTGSAAHRTVNVSLTTGDAITIVGTKGGGELARVDQIEISAIGGNTGGGGNTALPDITTGLTEAEDLDRAGYDLESRASASGGQLVRTARTGTITGEFQGDAGTYQLVVNYFDENDGVATFRVFVNGQLQSTFSGTGGQSAAGDPASRTISLTLSAGDEITVEGVRGGEELARIDSLFLTPSGGSGTGATLSFAGDNTAYTVDLAADRYAEAARILLLGDSLTEGAATAGGYRAPLWESITEDLGLWVDFVGSRNTNSSSELGDDDHQGQGGITAATVRGQINAIANANPTDYVLLMLGTNDALQTSNPQNTVSGNLLAIMQALEAANPDVKILLGTLPVTNRPEAVGEIGAINATLPSLVTQANNQGIEVSLVSFANITTNDYYDMLHPDAQGVQKFAANWLGGLTSVANQANGTYDGEAITISSAVSNVTGGTNNDRLLGDSGANVLNGSNGNDWLDGRGGNDTLTGGSGVDTFAFDASQDGDNTITDFTGGETIRLTGFGFSGTSQAGNAFLQQGSHVVFDRSGVSITILNASVSQVRSAVEVGSSPNYSPALASGTDDGFIFDAFTGLETTARIELVEADDDGAASSSQTDSPFLLTDAEDVFDLNDEIDPDSGLYY